MADKLETKIKNIKSINHLQNSAGMMEDLKAAFTESINSVLTLVNSRFEAMKLTVSQYKARMLHLMKKLND